ncbi:MAG TPA: hypothetical protein VGM56_30430, partial [Byssovorax sp.]
WQQIETNKKIGVMYPNDADCLNLCINAHPEGGSAYASLQHCVVCEQCSVACDGPSQGCGS